MVTKNKFFTFPAKLTPSGSRSMTYNLPQLTDVCTQFFWNAALTISVSA